MKTQLIAGLLGVGVALSGSVAEACSRKVPAEAKSQIVPEARIDQDLLDDAIRAEVNFHRCRAGLRQVADAGNGVAGMARGHSKWMAKTGTLSHKSSVRGKATLSQRMKASGAKYRTGAENIGMVHRYRIDNKRFKILSSDQCKFATYDGAPLPAHSYASLARHVVDLWMSSPGHRKNILNRDVNRISTGVAFDPSAQYCGQYWFTQNFVG